MTATLIYKRSSHQKYTHYQVELLSNGCQLSGNCLLLQISLEHIFLVPTSVIKECTHVLLFLALPNCLLSVSFVFIFTVL